MSCFVHFGKLKKSLVNVCIASCTQQIKDGFAEGKDLIVTVMSSMGEEQICALKDIGPKRLFFSLIGQVAWGSETWNVFYANRLILAEAASVFIDISQRNTFLAAVLSGFIDMSQRNTIMGVIAAHVVLFFVCLLLKFICSLFIFFFCFRLFCWWYLVSLFTVRLYWCLRFFTGRTHYLA